jgi:hypothetical protein
LGYLQGLGRFVNAAHAAEGVLPVSCLTARARISPVFISRVAGAMIYLLNLFSRVCPLHTICGWKGRLRSRTARSTARRR